MKIEITSPCPKVATAVRQHLGRSTHTYELWFLGDMVGEPLPKNRASFNALLKEAHQLLADAFAAEPALGYGEAEIVHREHQFGHCLFDETAWSMSMNEFKKTL